MGKPLKVGDRVEVDTSEHHLRVDYKVYGEVIGLKDDLVDIKLERAFPGAFMDYRNVKAPRDLVKRARQVSPKDSSEGDK